jgi:hypothetical protein
MGIVLLIMGSVMAVEYFSFYCFPALQMVYMSLTAAFAVVTGYVTFSYGSRLGSLALASPPRCPSAAAPYAGLISLLPRVAALTWKEIL